MAKHDLVFEPPIMNSAGCLGFAPDSHGPLDLSQLGMFITNPISMLPRTPAKGIRFVDYSGGFLLHSGFPNPGLAAAIRRYAGPWKRSPLPVIVHLIARSPEELARMVRQLEMVDGVSGLEVGFASDATSGLVAAGVQAVSGELPVIARLPFERCLELAGAATQAGAAAVSLAAPRGTLRMQDGAWVQGRLFGPSVLPMAIRLLQELKAQGVSTIGSGGLYSRDDLQAMLSAGAIAVQLDSVLWRGNGLPAPG